MSDLFERDAAAPSCHLQASPKQLRRVLRAFHEDVERFRDKLGSLVDLVDDMQTPSESRDDRIRKSCERETIQDHERLLEKMGQRGIGELVLEIRPHGKTLAIVDGVRIELSRDLGILLDILAADRGASEDRLVGWKSTGEIRQNLETRLEKSFAPHALDVSVLRLRSALHDAGVNPFLIHTDPRLGKRFALRRASRSRAET